jgi:hypothetical protein
MAKPFAPVLPGVGRVSAPMFEHRPFDNVPGGLIELCTR